MGALTRRKIPTLVAVAALAGAGLAVLPTVAPATVIEGAIEGCGAADHPGGEWRSYGHDQTNTRHQEAEDTIGPLEAVTLEPVWTLSMVEASGLDSAGDVTGTPTVADGCLFVGTNGGVVVAADADTGEVAWTAEVPAGGGISSSLTVADGVVYAAVSRYPCGPDCGGSYVLALDETDGTELWHSVAIDHQSGSDVFGSPVLVDAPGGRRAVMIGVSGGAAELGDEEARYAFQGAMVFLDIDNHGSLIRKEWTIHPPLGEPDGTDDDYSGGTIWSTPAIVEVPGVGTRAFVGTGNPFKPWAEHEHTNAVVAFDVDPDSTTWGTIAGSYKGNVDSYYPTPDDLPCFDIEGNPPPWYPQGAGSCFDVDLDFGASPNAFTDPETGRLLIGAGQKSGVYHVFDAETFEPAWTALVGPGGPVGGVVGSTAFDGEAIYGPVTVPGYVWSVGLDGIQRWVTPLADGVHWGNPVAVANGVVYTMDFAGNLNALDAATGVPLLKRPVHLGSELGFDAPLSWAGVSVARNAVYGAVGIQGLPDGFVVAFRPSTSISTPALPEVPDVPEPPGGPDIPTGVGGVAVAGPGALLTTYATPVVAVGQGEPVTFSNLDIASHDVDSVDGLWDSPLIGLGESDTIDEIATLSPGQYGFFCSLHRNMTGTLVVV
ncbi:MAG TPA: PQQ-binding-like beta-propeller repeat protein [Acidimicrobiales bacterium]